MDAVDTLFQLSKKHGKYPPGAYAFVFEILDYVAANKVKQHLTGRELALSAFVYSLHKYGLLAKMIWEQMNMKVSEDLGQIVFHLVEAGLIKKQQEDRVEDFDKVFTIDDFDDVKMELTGQVEHWVHLTDKDKSLNFNYVPPQKLGLELK